MKEQENSEEISKEKLALEKDETQQDTPTEMATEPDQHDTVMESLEADLSAAKEELNETKDKYLRLYSEFENFRRRTAKEKLELIQSANEQLVKLLLPVIDDFERAQSAIAEPGHKDIEGFLLIQNKFRRILEQSSVKPMAIEKGSPFDAETQEAITQIPAPEEKLKGKVIDVVEKGYLLNEKVIRYAKVVVGN